jgi:hypothetical protein
VPRIKQLKPQARAISPICAEHPQKRDSLADDAVCCELLSVNRVKPVDTLAAVDKAVVDKALRRLTRRWLTGLLNSGSELIKHRLTIVYITAFCKVGFAGSLRRLSLVNDDVALLAGPGPAWQVQSAVLLAPALERLLGASRFPEAVRRGHIAGRPRPNLPW